MCRTGQTAVNTSLVLQKTTRTKGERSWAVIASSGGYIDEPSGCGTNQA